VLLSHGAYAQEDPPLEPTPELPAPVDAAPVEPVPPVDELAPASPPGPVAGPGLPWQIVLVVQLVSYMLADALPYLGCVVGSWMASLTVVAGPALLIGIVLVGVLVPLAAIVSGCASAAVLQWLGDRLGAQRGRLFFVGLASIGLSAVTYFLVIAPIILGMGFFAAAAYGALSAFLVIPRLQLPFENVPPWLVPLLAYSVPAVGAVAAVIILAIGAVTAPILGFVIRPILVAITYRLTSRERSAGEEQWPPSLFGEAMDAWPRPPWSRAEAAPVKAAPAAPPPPSPPQGTAPQAPLQAVGF